MEWRSSTPCAFVVWHLYAAEGALRAQCIGRAACLLATESCSAGSQARTGPGSLCCCALSGSTSSTARICSVIVCCLALALQLVHTLRCWYSNMQMDIYVLSVHTAAAPAITLPNSASINRLMTVLTPANYAISARRRQDVRAGDVQARACFMALRHHYVVSSSCHPNRRRRDVRAGDLQLQQVCGLHGHAARVDRHPRCPEVCRRQQSAGARLACVVVICLRLLSSRWSKTRKRHRQSVLNTHAVTWLSSCSPAADALCEFLGDDRRLRGPCCTQLQTLRPQYIANVTSVLFTSCVVMLALYLLCVRAGCVGSRCQHSVQWRQQRVAGGRHRVPQGDCGRHHNRRLDLQEQAIGCWTGINTLIMVTISCPAAGGAEPGGGPGVVLQGEREHPAGGAGCTTPFQTWLSRVSLFSNPRWDSEDANPKHTYPVGGKVFATEHPKRHNGHMRTPRPNKTVLGCIVAQQGACLSCQPVCMSEEAGQVRSEPAA